MPNIGIDTNIFLHLLNPLENHDSHIDKLLGQLIEMQYFLLEDSTKKIGNEYLKMIVPMLRNKDETRPQLPLLRYWMNPDIRHSVELNPKDSLMQKIKEVIHEINEHADRAFVYVVCREDAILVTNDLVHIFKRRKELLRRTKKHRGNRTAIHSSMEALQLVVAQGEA